MSIYDFTVETASGEKKELQDFEGKVLLIVNTASKCGFTPQYQGLQELYEKYQDQGFVVLGFPCNQFGAQEPGRDEEIQSFCQINYGVKFPVFAKIDVNGNSAHPLYQYLKKEASGMLGNAIKWNFTKFLVDRNGKVVDRFAPTTKPQDLEKEIEKVL
ncbi:glutathione peroxidase [Risungbinella massiliensis]|uniref:glutathione peroxidase n=1 Tax=Risungbinella massiliensis TaxID=1329796 RepID=UPI0005CC22F7|nr:glutathione peroxidase [Risungbinella massiliensis]